MSDNAVAVIEKPRELSVVEVKAQVGKVQTLMHELMQEGTHYGESFPGDTKKNLLKPGADKLCFMFRLRPDFTQEIKELPNGHMEVITRCQIFHIESGQKIADGVGLATTMESKYRWRNSAKKCPQCGKETIKKSKYESGGFYCYEKIGGCGAKFKGDDPSITEQTVGKVENTDIADTYNTVIKMSKKRAYVDATITACAASDIFSQDAEDFKDTGESLAHEASQEEPRSVNEPPAQSGGSTQNTETPKPESKKIVDGIVAMLTEKTPDITDFFTDEERQNVKTKILETNGDVVKLKAIAADCEGELRRRKNEYQPIPFEDKPPAANVTDEERARIAAGIAKDLGLKPASAATQKTTTATPAAADGFVDDIPGQEEQVPAMYEELETELVGAGTGDALDIF